MLPYLFTLPNQDNFLENSSKNQSSILGRNFTNCTDSEAKSDKKKIIIVGNTRDCLKVVQSYGQMPSYFDISIINLGFFKNSSSNFKVQALSEILQDPSYYTVIVSEDPLANECYKALTNQNRPIKPAFITNSSDDIIIPSDQVDPCLDDFAALGIQKHMSNPNLFHQFEKKSYNFLRLGQLRNNFRECEVVLRRANYVHFNLDVIKSSEMPFNLESSQCGLTMEEACKLMKYVGLAPNLRIMSLEGINPEAPTSYFDKVATLLWYWTEAIDKRDELESLSNQGNAQEYIISLNEVDQPLRFVMNTSENRWWLSLYDLNHEQKLYPCSESDYHLAKNNMISDRILKIMDSV